MLDALRLVSQAVATRDIVPAFTFFHVYELNGEYRVQAANGRLAMDSPVQATAAMTVKADRLLSALESMPDAKITVGPNRVTVSKGRARVYIPTLNPAAFPKTEPDVAHKHPIGNVREAFRRVREYISTDASRPWSTGLYVDAEYCYATNNVIIARSPCSMLAGDDKPVNVPVGIVDAVLSRESEPTHFAESENSVTLYYADGSWVKSQVFVESWPVHVLHDLFGNLRADGWLHIDAELKEAFALAERFAEDRVALCGVTAGTFTLDTGEFEQEGFETVPEARFNVRMTGLALAPATEVLWHYRKDIHALRGDGIELILAGIRT